MSLDDIRRDIIDAVKELTDVALLEKIKRSVHQTDSRNLQSVWQGAEVNIRQGVSFEDIMVEQNYQRVSFDEFTQLGCQDDWEVSLDVLLSNAN